MELLRKVVPFLLVVLVVLQCGIAVMQWRARVMQKEIQRRLDEVTKINDHTRALINAIPRPCVPGMTLEPGESCTLVLPLGPHFDKTP